MTLIPLEPLLTAAPLDLAGNTGSRLAPTPDSASSFADLLRQRDQRPPEAPVEAERSAPPDRPGPTDPQTEDSPQGADAAANEARPPDSSDDSEPASTQSAETSDNRESERASASDAEPPASDESDDNDEPNDTATEDPQSGQAPVDASSAVKTDPTAADDAKSTVATPISPASREASAGEGGQHTDSPNDADRVPETNDPSPVDPKRQPARATQPGAAAASPVATDGEPQQPAPTVEPTAASEVPPSDAKANVTAHANADASPNQRSKKSGEPNGEKTDPSTTTPPRGSADDAAPAADATDNEEQPTRSGSARGKRESTGQSATTGNPGTQATLPTQKPTAADQNAVSLIPQDVPSATADSATGADSAESAIPTTPGSDGPKSPAVPTSAPSDANAGGATAPALSRGPTQLLARGSDRPASPAPLSDADHVRLVQRVARAFQAAEARDGEVRIRLSPPELGSLRIEIRVDAGTMQARLEAETFMARNALLENLPALRERLAEQNIQIEQFDVDVTDRRSDDLPDHPDRQPAASRRPTPDHNQAQPDSEEHSPSARDPSSPWPTDNGGINVIA